MWRDRETTLEGLPDVMIWWRGRGCVVSLIGRLRLSADTSKGMHKLAHDTPTEGGREVLAAYPGYEARMI